MLNQAPQPYAPVIIKLLKGVVYNDDPHWEKLQNNLTPIREYFVQIGVDLYNDNREGFAYLTQPREIEIEGKKEVLPRLTSSHKLNLNTTIFCVLLRMRLQEFDASEQIGRAIISLEDIRKLLEPYLEKTNNEKKFRDEVNTLVNNVKKLGILKELSGDDEKYEIRRIIKAKIDADTLEELKQKLENLKQI